MDTISISEPRLLAIRVGDQLQDDGIDFGNGRSLHGDAWPCDQTALSPWEGTMRIARGDKGRLLGLILATVLILIAATRCDRAREQTPPSASKASTPTGVPDWRRIAFAQQKVTELLRDPDSAVFSDVRVSRLSGTPVVCGFVNSRNGFGGMIGPQRFVSGAVTALEEQMAKGEMDHLWPKVCT